MSTIDLFDENNPLGSDFRYEKKFMEVEKEIDKLTNSNDVHTVDWKKIKENSFDILTTDSKDIKVFCWLLFAYFRDNDLDNFLKEGANLKSLLENHFIDLFPKSKKAKASSFLWLMGKTTNFVQQYDENFKKLPQKELKQIIKIFSDMDEITKDFHLNIRIDFKKIGKVFAKFIIDENIKEEASTINQSLDNQQVNQKPSDQNNDHGNLEISTDDEKDNSKLNNNINTNKTISSMNLDTKDNLQNPTQENLSLENLSLEELKNKSFKYMKDFIAINKADKNINANCIKINRFISWLDILKAPNYDESHTVMLSPPPEHIVNSIKLKIENNNFKEAFFDIEDTITTSPLWITAHYLSYTCLMKLEFKELANLVQHQIMQLISLDENMLNCIFNNGLELADENTRKWINTFNKNKTDKNNSHVHSENPTPVKENTHITSHQVTSPQATPEKITERKSPILTDGFSQDMYVLQEEYKYASSLKSQVKIRLKQAKLCMDNHRHKLAFNISSEVENELIKLKIDMWDPPLYCDSLVLMNESLSYIFMAEAHQEVFNYISHKLSFLNPTVLL